MAHILVSYLRTATQNKLLDRPWAPRSALEGRPVSKQARRPEEFTNWLLLGNRETVLCRDYIT